MSTAVEAFLAAHLQSFHIYSPLLSVSSYRVSVLKPILLFHLCDVTGCNVYSGKPPTQCKKLRELH